MRNKSSLAAIGTTLSLSISTAFAANPTAYLNVTQEGGPSWFQNMSGLLVLDAQNNFSMLQGTGTTGLIRDGNFVSASALKAGDEYWAWNAAGGNTPANWTWHSADTVDGSKPLNATPDNPWMSILRLSSVVGHGDPDIAYAFSAVNNSLVTQTYSFTIGESIFPTVSTANTVNADVSGGLTTKDGAVTIAPIPGNTTIQHFELSSNNGLSFVNAGVDVGPALSANATATYGVHASGDLAGPTGQTWDYIQIVTKFTLTGKDTAGLVGYASITPVPEPEGYAMLLAGLGLIGYIARRRRGGHA